MTARSLWIGIASCCAVVFLGAFSAVMFRGEIIGIGGWSGRIAAGVLCALEGDEEKKERCGKQLEAEAEAGLEPPLFNMAAGSDAAPAAGSFRQRSLRVTPRSKTWMAFSRGRSPDSSSLTTASRSVRPCSKFQSGRGSSGMLLGIVTRGEEHSWIVRCPAHNGFGRSGPAGGLLGHRTFRQFAEERQPDHFTLGGGIEHVNPTA